GVTGAREGVADAPGTTAMARRPTVKAPGSEQGEESIPLPSVLLYIVAPQLPKRAHDDLHLRNVRATPGAGPPVPFATFTIGRGQRAVQVGGDELHELPARQAGR